MYCDCYNTTVCLAQGGNCIPGVECSGSGLTPILGLCPSDFL